MLAVSPLKLHVDRRLVVGAEDGRCLTFKLDMEGGAITKITTVSHYNEVQTEDCVDQYELTMICLDAWRAIDDTKIVWVFLDTSC